LKNLRLLLSCLGLALLPAALGLYFQFPEALDIEVRTVPHRTQTGRLQQGLPVGQGFTCEFGGLRRIDVALVALTAPQDDPLELVLRSTSSDGEILRRVQTSQLPTGRGWGRFEFEPIEHSAGQDYWWQLVLAGDKRQSPYSTWTRYHGQIGIDMAWGRRIVRESVNEGRLFAPGWHTGAAAAYDKVPHPNLCAVSFAAETLRPAVGPVTFELWGPEQAAFQGTPLRSVSLTASEATHGGYAFFAFEPIPDSRWKDYSFRLTTPQGARLVGADEGLTFMTWHGLRATQPGLLGMSQGESVHLDRSAIFRAYSAPGAQDLIARTLKRAPWTLGLGGLVWFLALLCLAHAFRRP
jgi:hypothetical protein